MKHLIQCFHIHYLIFDRVCRNCLEERVQIKLKRSGHMTLMFTGEDKKNLIAPKFKSMLRKLIFVMYEIFNLMILHEF